MLEVIFLFVLGLIWILFATVQDLKTREVANWLNFSLVVFALGFRFFYSLFSNNWSFLIQGLLGFGLFFILGNILYYSRVFAGGDAKLFIALGSILPVYGFFLGNLILFVEFLVIFLLAGSLYGLSFSGVLMFKNFNQFKKKFSMKLKKYRVYFFSFLFLAILFLIVGFFYSVFFFASLLVFVLPYLFVYAFALEEVCMKRIVSSKTLSVGDWLSKTVRIRGHIIKPRWEGLSEKEVRLIKKYKKFVEIKQGIPFVPAFLISYLVFWILVFFGII